MGRIYVEKNPIPARLEVKGLCQPLSFSHRDRSNPAQKGKHTKNGVLKHSKLKSQPTQSQHFYCESSGSYASSIKVLCFQNIIKPGAEDA